MQLVNQKLANSLPKFKALINQLRNKVLFNKKLNNTKQKNLLSKLYKSFAVYQAKAYNIISNYTLCNSVILNPITTIYIINN